MFRTPFRLTVLVLDFEQIHFTGEEQGPVVQNLTKLLDNVTLKFLSWNILKYGKYIHIFF